MKWDEIRVRLGQGLHKRGDLLRHQLGMRQGARQLPTSAAPASKFFFAHEEAAERAQLMRQHLPSEAAKIVREADEICQHRFRLLGYENLDYGAEIDWHLDRVHGKRAPLDPWFRIPFLEFGLVGDHKVTWELNRHQHLVTLAKAWRLTGAEKYIGELIAQWRSWMKANPYPLGINWTSTLEVAFRSLSWIWVDQLIAEDPGRGRSALQSEFRAGLLPALALHGHYIDRYLSTYFSPNTHLLGEAAALFFLGTLYPEIPHAGCWKDEGWKIVLREAGRQVRPDGVYFEQSLYYHVYALDLFLYVRMLAAANDVDIPATFDGVLHRMLNVVEALAQAGPAEDFGDDDGGRVFNPRRNRTEHMTDPLAVGALAHNRDDLAAAQLTEESIWLFGKRAIAELPRAKKQTTARSVAFPNGGVYVLAGPVPCSQTMVIDAGPQGEGCCGHGHADALSLRFTMNGLRWLVDSGTGIYMAADPKDRDTFRGTAAHNTLRIDGVDQAVPDEPFSWTEIPTTSAERWISAKTFTYFVGSHNGYERLPHAVTHRRSVLCVNGSSWLVRDVAMGSAEHDLELHWHFASDVSVREAGPGELVASHSKAEQTALCLILPKQTGWKTVITRALLSPAYGRYQPAPVVRCEARAQLPTEIATAFLVAAPSGETRDQPRMISMHLAAVQVYELHDHDERHGFLFARGTQPWNFGPWASDAELLYWRIEKEKLAQLIVIGGTSVTWQGQPLLTARGPSQWFEWRKQDGTKHAEPELFSTTPLFHELTGTHFSSGAPPVGDRRGQVGHS